MSGMRRILIAVLGLVVLLIGLGMAMPNVRDWIERPTLTQEPPADDQRLVTTTDVNLREGPGLDFAILETIPEGTEVVVSGDSDRGFVPVEAAGARGWMSQDYLHTPQDYDAVFTTTANAQEMRLDSVDEVDVQSAMLTEEPVVAVSEVVTVADTETATANTDEPDAPMDASVGEADVPSDDSALDPVDQRDVAVDEPVVVSGEANERWIEVDRSEAIVTLHDGDLIIAQFPALIGRDASPDGFYSTAVGTFHVFSMERNLAETPFVDGVYLTDWVGFDPERSNGFHSPTRDADGNVVVTGGTVTMGCVRLSEDAARQLFDFAELGMRVEIHD